MNISDTGFSSNTNQNQKSNNISQSTKKENPNLIALKNSSNLDIKKCAEDIDEFTKKLNNLQFDHKTTTYKRIDRELFKLMVKLDDIDVESDSSVKEERKIALTLIHELIRVLENKVDCKVNDCIICKTGIDLKNK
jgi:hypothetical protein